MKSNSGRQANANINRLIFFLIYFAVMGFLILVFSEIFSLNKPGGYAAMRSLFRGETGLMPFVRQADFRLMLSALGKSLVDTLALAMIFYLASHYRESMEHIHQKFINIPRGYFLSAIFLISLGVICFVFYFQKLTFPMTGDEHSYLTQARIMSMGRVYVASHPLRDFFYADWLVNNGRVYSEYAMGTPFLLMLGVLAGLPWLVNPLLAACTLVILYKIAGELFDETAARYGVCFVILFPLLRELASSYLSHTPELFFVALFFYLLLRSMRQGGVFVPVMAGAALGGLFTVRPLSGAIAGSVFGLWALYEMRKRAKDLLKLGVLFGCGLAVPAVSLMYANYLQNGSPFLFGYNIYYGPEKLFGFTAAHTPVKALATYLFRLWLLTYHFKFTPLSPYLFIFLVLITLFWKNKYSHLIWVFFFASNAGYALYTQGMIWDIRFYYPALVFLVLLIPEGIAEFNRRWGCYLWPAEGHHLTILILGLAVGYTLVNLGQQGLSPLPGEEALRKPYAMVEKAGIHRAIVFIKEVGSFYPEWYIRNSPLFDDDVLYALDLGDRNRDLMKYYPDRKYYLLEKDKLSPLPSP